MKREEDILKRLREEGEGLKIPETLEPENLGELLEKHTRTHRRGWKRNYMAAALAACFALAAGVSLYHSTPSFHAPDTAAEEEKIDTAKHEEPPAGSEEEIKEDSLELPAMTYEDIYARLSESWQALEKERSSTYGGKEEAIVFAEADMADAVSNLAASKSAAFGKTNVQVSGIDEASRIKNDGRYLYQIARKPSEDDGGSKYGIQILDTEDGLKETAFIGGLQGVEEFYLWEDMLIVIENKYGFYSALPIEGKTAVEDMALQKSAGLQGMNYHEITVYDIGNRAAPRKKKTFTLQGSYHTSRIYDGYFYGISSYTASPGGGEDDYDAYIPTLDGARLAPEKILCPEESSGSGYLVLVSIDLADPSKLMDSRAVLTDGSVYYVSRKNIYVAGYHSVYEELPKQEGKVTDHTSILKFSFQKGRFSAQASGDIPGRLNDSFSLDEYAGNLRAVSTVQEYQAKKVTDERTGELIGMNYGETVQTNALYILDGSLKISGSIEELAKGEQIYSARFLGDTGYFVTFRQTDPLFAVDLSDASAPAVLSELKVSGFSEYLHFYGENLLFGLGMEADEETGREEGMKLSMFDITDPANPAEVSRMNLTDYNYSEALWDHRALLIDTEENLIGFAAEGSDKGNYWMHYLVYVYEDGGFVQKLKLDTGGENHYGRVSGTFIGDVFYLLEEDGSARSYDRRSGELLEEIGGSLE